MICADASWKRFAHSAVFHGMLEVIMQFYAVIISQKPSQRCLSFFASLMPAETISISRHEMMNAFREIRCFTDSAIASFSSNVKTLNMSNDPSQLAIILPTELSISAFLTDSAFNFLCLIIFCAVASEQASDSVETHKWSAIILRPGKCADFSSKRRTKCGKSLTSSSSGRMSNAKMIFYDVENC